MSDIRLKTITVEPSNRLKLQKGDINITNTTLSSNILNGALVVDGGVSINCFGTSVSSTSGGALTIGGGVGIMGDAYMGNDLILDSYTSVISVLGISNDRLFLDTVSNKHFYVSPDGVSKRFDLYDTYCTINITKQSTNSTTGALIINGGVCINSTFNSVNSSNGGALTISGGMAIGGDSHLSKSLTIGQLYQNTYGLLVRYTGTSQIALQNSSGSNSSTINMNGDNLIVSNNSDLVFNSTSGNFIFSNTTNSLFSIDSLNNYSNFYKYVTITDTIESLNNTIGSFIVTGGVSVKCTTDSLSFTSGGAQTICGGLGISKKTYTGDSIGIELSNNNKNNKLMLYQVNKDLTQTNQFTGFGVSSGSLRFQVPDITNDYIFYSATTGSNSNEVFRIKGNSEVQFIGDLQRYSIKPGGYTQNDLSIQSQSISAPLSVCFFTTDGDSLDTNDIKIFGLGLPNNTTNSEYLKIGWDTSNYIISTNNNGTGVIKPIVLQSGINNQLVLLTDGSLLANSTKQSTNSSTGGLVLLGGLSINNTNDSVSLTNGGSLTTNGGISIKKSINVGNTVNIYSTSGNVKLYAQTSGNFVISNPTSNFIFTNNNTTSNTSSITLYSLNDNNNYESLVLSSTSTSGNGFYNINSSYGGSGYLRPLQINVGNNTDIFMNTNGNIGINTTNVSFQLDINGTVKGNNYNYFNELTIYSTNNATDENSSGSLTVMGGASIKTNLYVGGVTNFTNTDVSNQTSTNSAVSVAGGMYIQSTQQADYGYGALLVNGGASFDKSIYIGQDLNVMGSINGAAGSSNSFAYITVTASDNAINTTTGSLITFGGITIQTNQNAQNVSNGGALLVGGGASISQDMYIGGDMYNYGSSNYYDSQNNLINFYDVSNLKRFSFDRNTSTNAFSISRYDSFGTFVEKSLEISNSTGMTKFNNSSSSINNSSGSLITVGGITIQSTSESVSLSNGGGLTVYGGASVNKNLNVGGNVTIYSTTASSNANEGSLIVNGGVGVTGNLNVDGNTIINGDLTVNGTTNTINSTETLISDNIIVLNSAPAGSSDAGFVIQRYQINNDSGSGDVVNDLNDVHDLYTLPLQSGVTSTEVQLPTGSSSVNGYYVGWWIKVLSGFSVNQVRKVTGYVGSTHIITLDAPWTTQNPSIGDSVNLYNRPFVGIIWNELNDRFDFGSTVTNPGDGNVNFNEYTSIRCDAGGFTSSTNSINTSTGALVLTGGLGIMTTTDATSLTSGNGLTISGGASILKSLYVGTKMVVNGVNIQPNSFDIPSTTIYNGTNNVTNDPITGLDFDGTGAWGIDLYISIRLIATSNMYSNYHIRGVNKETVWSIVQSYVGDEIVYFSITNDGQLQYTCPNYTGFTSLTFKFKCISN